MAPHILRQAVLSDISILVQNYGPRMQKACNDLMHRGLSSSLICGIGSGTIEFNTITTGQAQVNTIMAGQTQVNSTTMSNQLQVCTVMTMGQIQVKDSTAPPVVKNGSYRFAPSMLTYKLRSGRRRSRGRGHNNNDDHDDGDYGNSGDDYGDGDHNDGPGWDEGGFGGSNNSGWNGYGGNNKDRFWGSSNNNHWNHEYENDSDWWESISDAILTFVYQVACWISLSQCLRFVLQKLLDAHQETSSVSSMVVNNYLSCSIRTSSASS